jgi:hypothetical protein
MSQGYVILNNLRRNTMTKPSMALSELIEKGADSDLLRQMVQYVAQRLMDMDVEGLCGARLRGANPGASQ